MTGLVICNRLGLPHAEDAHIEVGSRFPGECANPRPAPTEPKPEPCTVAGHRLTIVTNGPEPTMLVCQRCPVQWEVTLRAE